MALIERTIPLAEQHGWARTRAYLSPNLAEIHRTRGRLQAAIAEGEKAVALAREVGDPVLSAMTLGVLGNAWRAVHEPETALELFREGWRLSSQIAEPHTRAQSELLVAFPHMDLKNWDEADRFAAFSQETSRAHGIQFLYGAALAVRARVARERGDLPLAERLYRESSEVHLRSGHALAPLVELNLALLLVRQDRHDEARGIVARWRNSASARGMTMPSVLLTTLDAWLAAIDAQWDAVGPAITATEKTCSDAAFSEVDLGRAFVSIGDLAREAGHPDLARQSWMFAEKQLRQAHEEAEADAAARSLERLGER
jgi:tetratricopeptide (TPR) repeat protein